MTKILLISLTAAIAACVAISRESSVPRLEHAAVVPKLDTKASVRVASLDAPVLDAVPTPRERGVEDKYGILLDAANPSIRKALLSALALREQADPDNHRELAIRERELSLMLTNDQYALYDQLRESDHELASIQSLAAELADTFPLTADQQRSLLLTHLRSRDARAALELAASIVDPESVQMEDSYALDIARQGLAYYHQQFLDDARAILLEEQWAALAERESAALLSASVR